MNGWTVKASPSLHSGGKDEYAVLDASGCYVAMCGTGNLEAEFIVRAVNSHADLLAALEKMEPLLKSFDNWCRVDHHGQCKSHLGDKPSSVVAARRAFLAAIAKAKNTQVTGIRPASDQ